MTVGSWAMNRMCPSTSSARTTTQSRAPRKYVSTRNQKSETRNQKPEIGNQKCGSRKLNDHCHHPVPRSRSGFWFLVSGFWFLFHPSLFPKSHFAARFAGRYVESFVPLSTTEA